MRNLRQAVVCIVAALGCCSLAQRVAAQRTQQHPVPDLLLGAAWYPEQWPESRWLADVQQMQAAHLHVVRIGEFAWTAMEPHEGDYQLDWLERAVDLAGRHGIFVILGTPTAAPPEWMAHKYPGILTTDSTGRLWTGDTRNRDNWNSDRMREFARGIDEKLAERFGHNPYVIGWQVDNEFSHTSFDTDTQDQFHRWLQNRYKTIEALNQAWTTAYNNQTFSSFDEVPLVEGNADNSPGLWLDCKRFFSESLRSYQRVQIDSLRKYADPRQKITTNMMGWYDLYDHYTVAEDLDIVGWDNPQVTGTVDPVRNGAAHDLMRGLKPGSGNYWVLESTAGPRGGGNASIMLDRGAMRAAIWSYIGHGANLVSYWQWRDALNGGEQSHGALVDVDGEPDPTYSEYKQVAEEFEKLSPALRGTHPAARVAILHSYPSRWALNWQKMNPSYDPIDLLLSFYAPLHALGYTVDIVPPDRDLRGYQAVFAPGLNLLTQPESDRLRAYVQHGGHLIFGQRSAMKDEHNSRWPQRQPGPLSDLLGARVEQYTALDTPVEVTGTCPAASAREFAEQLHPNAPGVHTLMTYHAPRSWLDGEPAAVTRVVGSGSITYLGAWLDPAASKCFLSNMLAEAQAQPDVFPVPPGIEVYRRTDGRHNIFIVENFSDTEARVKLPTPMEDLLTGGSTGSLTLEPYGVHVLRGVATADHPRTP